jgi:hypothetical protein
MDSAESFINKNPEDIEKSIQIIERRDLDLVSEIEPQIYTERDRAEANFQFIRIHGISRSLPSKKSEVERYLMEDIISGLYGSKDPFIYLIIGSKSDIKVYLGILSINANQKIESLITSLYSTFPNIEISTLNGHDLEGHFFQFFRACKHFGIMTGIPTPKIGVEEYGIEQIERLLRGLYRQEFGYMVISDPIDDKEVINAFNDISAEIRSYSKLSKIASQFTKTTREILSTEEINKQVQNYLELLEVILNKIKIGKSTGVWRTATYFFSPYSSTADRMKTLLKVVFSGEKSAPEAIRTFSLNGKYRNALIEQFLQLKTELDYGFVSGKASHPLNRLMRYKYLTILNSRDLATLTHLPKEEMPGYDVKDSARFGVCLPPEKEEGRKIFLGEVIDRGLSTGNQCFIREDDFVKHGLIAGVTGSGKTNSCFYIINQLWNSPSSIPFLVIEPAKKEYRSLLNYEGFEVLQIFTLGNENISKFRLNPFEILEGVSVQTHIDYLRAVFNASFIMFAPMPYVLERCIHEIYRDKGWDLITGENIYIQSVKEYKKDIFPTLSDLYEKIDPVVSSLGYEEKFTMDIKAALKTRIGSLCMGGKGAMLDTRLSIPMENLLSRPTILELENIGDDEEKAFIIGLLISRLYEFRRKEKQETNGEGKLRHITLIEEAHRLLTKTPPVSGNLEIVNIKAKAVEAFCNILSEIRAYGEGILIAEQVPTKLAEDAIKNTNLKLVHRTVAKDDRDILGHTMNLNDEQNKYITILDKGYGVVFFEGLHESFLVKIPYFPDISKNLIRRKATIPTDADVKNKMAPFIADLNDIYTKQKGCEQCQDKCKYLEITKQLVSIEENIFIFSKYILSIIENKKNIIDRYSSLKNEITKSILDLSFTTEAKHNIIFCFCVNAGIRYFKQRMKQYNISSQKINILAESYFDLLNKWLKNDNGNSLSNETERAAELFRDTYNSTFSLEIGPYPECGQFCNHKCLFKYDVEPKSLDESLDLALRACYKRSQNSDGKVRKFCIEVGKGFTFGIETEFAKAIALCFFIQKLTNWRVEQSVLDIKRDFLLIPEVLL